MSIFIFLGGHRLYEAQKLELRSFHPFKHNHRIQGNFPLSRSLITIWRVSLVSILRFISFVFLFSSILFRLIIFLVYLYFSRIILMRIIFRQFLIILNFILSVSKFYYTFHDVFLSIYTFLLILGWSSGFWTISFIIFLVLLLVSYFYKL